MRASSASRTQQLESGPVPLTYSMVEWDRLCHADGQADIGASEGYRPWTSMVRSVREPDN